MPITRGEQNYFCRHRKKILCEVDAKPPLIKTGTFLRSTQLKTDNECLKRIITENTNLLEKLNEIQRIEGTVVSYNRFTPTRKTRIEDIKKWLKHIDKENYFLGRKLLCMTPTMMTREPLMELPRRKVVKPPHENDQYKKELLRRYKSVMPVADPNAMLLLLCPKIYLSLGVKNVRPMDRLVIMLYTEAAPSVVLQFIKMCKSGNSSLVFTRIYPNLWIEGQIDVPMDQTVGDTQKSLSYINHDQPGTVALLDRGQKGIFEFSISFKPIKVLNGKRVAFGKVVEGLKGFDCIQDYGTKNGKTKKTIEVTGCGLIKK